MRTICYNRKGLFSLGSERKLSKVREIAKKLLSIRYIVGGDISIVLAC